jgi:hypothetical protein
VTSDTLRAFDGQRHGKTLRFGAGKARDAFVEDWSEPKDFMAWPVRLNQPARYEVLAVYDAEAGSAGGTYTVKLGKPSLPGTVREGKNLQVSLGQVQLEAGPLDIEVVPHEIKGTELMGLRALVLKPAGP